MILRLNSWLTVVFITFVNTTDVQIALKPGPTVLVKENSKLDLKCEVSATDRSDWQTTLFYNELNLIGGFYNNSNECQMTDNSNSSLYSFKCNLTNDQFEMTVKSIPKAYDGKRIKCRVQYGYGNTDTDIFAEETTVIQISEIYKLNVSPTVLYFGRNISAVLTCMANDDDIIVRWIRNSSTRTVIYLVDEQGNCMFSGTADTRYEYRCDPENRRYYLIIPPSELTFENKNDEWRCAYIVGRTASDPVKLKIIDFPQVIISEISSCLSSNSVELKCMLNNSYSGQNKGYIWYHTYKDQKIRELNGKQDGDSFILMIPFCNFQDIGDYVCVWETDLPGLKYINTTANLQISGPPIISGYNVTNEETYMRLFVFIFSVPFPEDPKWLFDNKTINFGFKYSKTTRVSNVPIMLYGVTVYIEGFLSVLTILDKDGTDAGVYTCIVRNEVSTTVQNIDTKIDVKSATCEEQPCSVGLIAGVTTGCVIISIFLNISGHITYRYLTSRRSKDRKGTEQSNSQDLPPDTYDVLGMPDLPHTYESVTSST